ncbi:MAG: DNA-binding transcriptional MerR regulator [Sediminicola sp.]|jgi:DNA-binding transcriptional MerR regulator|tara:strand:+ start:3279 stop:4175 length:897 start_codon:yes stop_codon:yes gene_type:complete
MINSIKDTFTIQDLEILTGIKAHTIRIWEKRYDLLNPKRLNRNIRVYDLEDLQKILSVSLLYNNNYKISKIAKYTESELSDEAKSFALNEFSNNYEINSLVIAMYTFDEGLFQEIYSQQSKKISFLDIFVHTYIPLLNHMGLLWQTDSIIPAHEHFISNLIYQKISLNIALLPKIETKSEHVNILFLPFGEIHDLGLMFLNYTLKLKGEKVIYLGKSIPFDNLFHLNSQVKNCTWINYFMLDKPIEEKRDFLNNIEKLLAHTKNKCIIVGNVWEDFSKENTNDQITYKSGLEQLISTK